MYIFYYIHDSVHLSPHKKEDDLNSLCLKLFMLDMELWIHALYIVLLDRKGNIVLLI